VVGWIKFIYEFYMIYELFDLIKKTTYKWELIGKALWIFRVRLDWAYGKELMQIIKFLY